jgi:TPP-dependent pyruvate/acetoin dehydrogenase alpha subunit
MESDAFYLDGDDVEAVERAMNEKIEEIRGKGGEVSDVSFVVTRPGDQSRAEARFDYRLPPEEIGAEVEFDPGSVEDRVEQ